MTQSLSFARGVHFSHLKIKKCAFPCVFTALILFSSGCQTTERQPSPALRDELLIERIQNDRSLSVIDQEIKIPFASGTLELVEPGWFKGTGAAFRSGLSHDELKQLYARRLWPLIVNLIAKQNYGDDLHYYLLGYSAEQLGYPDAAITYYEKSIKLSDKPGGGKCVTCMSIKLPERAKSSLERVTFRKNKERN